MPVSALLSRRGLDFGLVCRLGRGPARSDVRRGYGRSRARIGGLLLVGLLVAPSIARADNESVAPAKTGKTEKVEPATAVRYDPENVTGISEAMETLVKGNARYVARDYAGAVDLFRKAMQMNPKLALAPYLLGEGLIAMNSLSEAETAFKQAAQLADNRNPSMRARTLFAVADILEREKKWTEAQTAWQAYNEFASKVGTEGGAYPKNGAERLKAVEAVMKLDKDYDAVRQRIAANKAEAAAGASAKPGATPAKAPTKK